MAKRTPKNEDKMYIVRKYVKAVSVSDAIRKEPKVKVHEIYVDEEWRKNQKDNLANAIGFNYDKA